MDPEFLGSATLTQVTIPFSELKIKHYKIILKCIFGDDIDYNFTFKNIDNILVTLTGKPLAYIQQLSFLDYFLLLLEVRNISIGSLIVAETTDDSSTKIDINVQKLIETLQTINLQQVLTSDVVDEFIIKYKLPTMSNVVSINNTNSINTVYNFFIDTIEHKKTVLDFKILNDENINIVLEKIPAKITTRIIKKVQNIVEAFNNVNLISYLPGLENKQLIFNFNIKNLEVLLKLLFGDQLLSLYENIFKLSKTGNMPPQYIENCTPGEYMLYTKKLEASLSMGQQDDMYNSVSVDHQDTMMDID
jgi:hypothetical protein